ncbi:UNVERIFIED_CONTAM: hypothetical protein K2H54_006340 [Gekko kuhli]
MRASFLSSLLSIVVCIHIAHATFCFTCEDQTSNWRCLRVTWCPGEDSRCLTMGTVSGAENDTTLLITKKCADKCPSEEDPVGRASNSLFCCEGHLCNIRPPK